MSHEVCNEHFKCSIGKDEKHDIKTFEFINKHYVINKIYREFKGNKQYECAVQVDGEVWYFMFTCFSELAVHPDYVLDIVDRAISFIDGLTGKSKNDKKEVRKEVTKCTNKVKNWLQSQVLSSMDIQSRSVPKAPEYKSSKSKSIEEQENVCVIEKGRETPDNSDISESGVSFDTAINRENLDPYAEERVKLKQLHSELEVQSLDKFLNEVEDISEL